MNVFVSEMTFLFCCLEFSILEKLRVLASKAVLELPRLCFYFQKTSVQILLPVRPVSGGGPVGVQPVSGGLLLQQYLPNEGLGGDPQRRVCSCARSVKQ